MPKLPLATLPNDRFWVSLSYSMMMTITGLCWIAALNVRRNRGYVFPLLLAKAASALSSLVLFFAVTHQLASLVIFFVDGSIFWITLFFFVRAQRAGSLARRSIDKVFASAPSPRGCSAPFTQTSKG